MASTSNSSYLAPLELCFFNVLEPTKPTPTTAEINVCIQGTTNNLTLVGNGNANVTISGVATPTLGTDAVNKDYVDSLVATGITWKNAVQAGTASTAELSGATYSAPDTITGGTTAIDNVALDIGDRILIKDGVGSHPTVNGTSVANGIYVVSNIGGTTAVYTRSTDAVTSVQASGAAVLIIAGTINDDRAYVCTTTGAAPDFDPVNFGAAIEFSQFQATATPSAPVNSVQFNNAGSFGGTAGFTFDGSTLAPTVTIGNDGTSTSGNLDVGTGTAVTSATFDLGSGTGTNTTASITLADGTGTSTIDAQGSGLFTVQSTGGSSLFTSSAGSTTLSSTSVGGGVTVSATAADVTLQTLTSGGIVVNAADITTAITATDNTGTILEVQTQQILVDGAATTANIAFTGFAQPTFANGSTVNIASTIYIEGAPTAAAATTSTIAEPYAIWVDSGDSRFDGDVVLYSDVAGAGTTLSASTNTTNWTLTFPVDGGTNGYVLTTDGNGVTSWQPTSGGGATTQLLQTHFFVGDVNNEPQDQGDVITFSTAVVNGPVFTIGNASSTTVTVNLGTAAASTSNVVLNMASSSGSSTIDAQGSGTFTIQASGDAAPIVIDSGDATTAGVGGAITLTSGNGLTNSDGGAISMTAGGGDGTGDGGDVNITSGATSGASTASIGGDINLTLSASTHTVSAPIMRFKLGQDKDTFQDDTGNFFLFEAANGDGTGALTNPGFLSRLLDDGDWYGSKFRTVSDGQFKTQIKTIDDPLNTIRKVEGYTYRWKKSFMPNRQKKNREHGVIAQQLEDAGLEDLVDSDTVGAKTVDYMGLVPIVIEAMKELANQVDELRGVEPKNMVPKSYAKKNISSKNKKSEKSELKIVKSGKKKEAIVKAVKPKYRAKKQ